jgi:hypothetical protein
MQPVRVLARDYVIPVVPILHALEMQRNSECYAAR